MKNTDGGVEEGPLVSVIGTAPREGAPFLLLVFTQLICLFAVSAYCAVASGWTPALVGFFCNDDSIRFPFLPQTVPFGMVTVLMVVVPIVLLLLLDGLAWLTYGETLSSPVHVNFCRVPGLLRLYYVSVGGFVFALLCTLAITVTGKVLIGRLRPHFLSVCQPDWSKIKCSDSSGFLYIDKYACNSKDEKALNDARASFPSGHSSTSMCAMVFFVIYLQSRLIWLENTGLKPSSSSPRAVRGLWRTVQWLCPFIQLTAIASAFFVGFTRIKDKYHHPSDVVAGFAIGALIALYAAFYIAGFGSYRLVQRKILSYTKEDESDFTV